jgi:SAM-dependent methyltransferase
VSVRPVQPAPEPARDLSPADWEVLRELRAGYLQRSEGGAPGPLDVGWAGARELALYDAVFGARIGWKWRAVLREVAWRRIAPPRGLVLDWGCGTGVAARAWVEAFGPEGLRVALWDRSAAARAFAAQRLRERWPALAVEVLDEPPRAAPDVLLASHVLGELDEPGVEALTGLARGSRFVAWVEPGSRAISRALGAARERLRGDLAVLAPCPHAGACGALAPGREADWCHHFAPPAPEAFTTRLWSIAARELGIDLRSLPYAFVVLGRGAPPLDVPDAARVLGRPRLEKGRALLSVCMHGGLRDLRLLERTDRAFHRSLAAPGERPRLVRLSEQGGRVERLEPFEPGAPWQADEAG